jgi:AcrR family transcriptional regulator
MTRTYTLKRRAESQAATRRRIVEAAVELHSSIGPALTTISMVAERAGVQRHTFYAHFPGDRCERLRVGLFAIYQWYQRNAELAACVLRDAETHPLTKEIAAMRFGPYMAAYQDVLGAKLTAKQRAVFLLALSFFTWRTLVREGGLKQGAAVEAMVQAIDCAK